MGMKCSPRSRGDCGCDHVLERWYRSVDHDVGQLRRVETAVTVNGRSFVYGGYTEYCGSSWALAVSGGGSSMVCRRVLWKRCEMAGDRKSKKKKRRRKVKQGRTNGCSTSGLSLCSQAPHVHTCGAPQALRQTVERLLGYQLVDYRISLHHLCESCL